MTVHPTRCITIAWNEKEDESEFMPCVSTCYFVDVIGQTRQILAYDSTDK